jgi:hypothetical protein
LPQNRANFGFAALEADERISDAMGLIIRNARA